MTELKQSTRIGADATIRQLTEGFSLPLPPLQRLQVEVICKGLLHIWQVLVEREPEAVAVSDEPGLNSVLVSAINRQLALDDPDLRAFAMLVQRAESGVQAPNYQGDRLELRPDICLPLKARGPAFLHPLVVECKILDRPQKKTVPLYCKEGLLQFVNGDYAWTRQEGFMFAYVRDGSTIGDSLTPFLSNSMQSGTDDYGTLCLPESVDTAVDQAVSNHRRSFRYVDSASKDLPGAIVIRHLWVDARHRK